MLIHRARRARFKVKASQRRYCGFLFERGGLSGGGSDEEEVMIVVIVGCIRGHLFIYLLVGRRAIFAIMGFACILHVCCGGDCARAR